MRNKYLILILIPLFLSSCSLNSETRTTFYLNYDYKLVRAGDIHGEDPATHETLEQFKNYTSYISLFNSGKSHINFQCVGSNLDNFHCNTTFVIYDKNSNCILGSDDNIFRTTYSGQQKGKVIYEDSSLVETFGTIYVYTPYWCRCQIEYDIDGHGNIKLLTLEFWKNKFNDVPEWSK